MYSLRAAIAAETVLRELTASLDGAPIVPLGQHLFLLPLTDEHAAEIPALAACSTVGPVARVEAEYFGGTGTQSAQVWQDGDVVLGPLHLAEGEAPPADGSPISRALRRIGAVRGDHFDEFDAVGLGRHRVTDRWLPAVPPTNPGDLLSDLPR